MSLKAFTDHHRPDGVLLTGALDPALAAALDRHALPAIWVDAQPAPPRRWSLLPRGGDSLPRTVLAILAESETAAAQLARTRDTAGRIEHVGPLSPVPQPLPYSVGERDALARVLSGRPVWLAACPAPAEFPAILAAHRQASRLSHRLLMIAVVPPDVAPDLARMAADDGWHVGLRSEDDEPGPDMQVFIGDDLEELGLWYRLASITFLGGTLEGAGTPRPPFEAATLGSALLHGPKLAAYAAEVEMLAGARAARRVTDAESLGNAVKHLLSPDVAAGMAAAGWDVTTKGAPAINRTIALVEDMLDGALHR